MSWLHIIHQMTYRYNRAVRFGPHRLVLRPREGHDVHIEEMRLKIEPVSGTFFDEHDSYRGMQVAVQTARFEDLETLGVSFVGANQSQLSGRTDRANFYQSPSAAGGSTALQDWERGSDREKNSCNLRTAVMLAELLIASCKPIYGRPRKEPMRFSGSMRSQKILKVAKMGTASNVPATPQR